MRAIVDNHVAAAPMARTPRQNSEISQRLGGFATIAEGLDYAAQGSTGFNFYSSKGVLDRVLPYSELRRLALLTARKLNCLGLPAGARIGILAETGANFMAAFFGCQYAGFVPCPIPYSMHIGGKDAYIARVAGMLRAADAYAVLTTHDMLPYMSAAADQANVAMVLTHEALQSQPESITPLAGFGPDDVAYIQYSSGSTSEPKGVLITQRAIMANATGILRHGLAITPADRAFSWLPLYHDMGLVGFCLAPLLGQVTVDYMSTTAFARRPALWLRLMSQNKSTVCYSPSFGYDLAGRRINGEAATLDLSAWRIAGIGGDMVRSDVLNTFAKALEPAGFNPAAFLPSYGMAESTLAISFSPTNAPLRVDTISRKSYKLDRLAVPFDAKSAAASAGSRSFVVCGTPLPDHRIEVRNDDGMPLRERQIGHIFVSGPSLMAGYFNREDATCEVLGADGFLDTGDMGYLVDGAIVITGRAKDLILHNGRNIWPQDIEWSAEKIEPLRSGDVAAFAVEAENGEDDVVVLVQCRDTDASEQEKLRRKVGSVVHQSAGVDCKIVLIAPRSLPFTSSGKLSRAGARQMYLDGQLTDVAWLHEQPFLQAAQ